MLPKARMFKTNIPNDRTIPSIFHILSTSLTLSVSRAQLYNSIDCVQWCRPQGLDCLFVSCHGQIVFLGINMQRPTSGRLDLCYGKTAIKTTTEIYCHASRKQTWELRTTDKQRWCWFAFMQPRGGFDQMLKFFQFLDAWALANTKRDGKTPTCRLYSDACRKKTLVYFYGKGEKIWCPPKIST